MGDLRDANFFRDPDLQADPYPYFDALRATNPIWQEPHYGVFVATGYDEALEIYNDSEHFSSCNAVSGPFVAFPEPFDGDDATELIDRYRDTLPFSDQLPSFDPPRHTEHRALMMRLLTPRRLRENEQFMERLADERLAKLVADGGCEFIREFAAPFTLVVIAELEGVPEEDHDLFREGMSKVSKELQHKPLEFLYEQFTRYVEDRRANPRDDIMTSMATATFPDGTLPDVHDIVLLAANLYTGGQETTVRLLSFALRALAEDPALQARLRADRSLIANFIEEILRLESPLRTQFRMAKTTTTVAGVRIPAGATVMLVPGAANRDPRTFERPDRFDLDRADAKYHLAFGHGTHHCAGAHLARAETRVTIGRVFDHTTSITIDDDVHGPAGDRRYSYLPTYFLRGLNRLALRFEPAA